MNRDSLPDRAGRKQRSAFHALGFGNGGTLGTVERLEWWNAGDYPLSTSTRVLPSRAGEGDTLIPAASMAAILDSASPLPPAMMAPAWPMRRPGGAVRPAIKPTIGFLRPRLASSLRN